MFGQKLNEESPSPEHIVARQHQRFVPPSPPRALIRSLRRSGEKPTCILFGPHRETLYEGFFFCANCKKYEDMLTSGCIGRVKRNSTRFKCTARHTDFMFPTHKIEVNVDRIRARDEAEKRRCSNVGMHGKRPPTCEEQLLAENSDSSANVNNSDNDNPFYDGDALQDLITYAGALISCETLFKEKLQEKEVLLRSEKELAKLLEVEVARLFELVNEKDAQLKEMRQKVYSLSNLLNYYRKKKEESEKEQQSLPLDKAVVREITKLTHSRQRYKLMLKRNAAAAIAKAMFSPDFLDGLVLEEVMKEAKKWLHKHIFTPAAMKGRLIPTPACLQRVARLLEKEGEQLCPFTTINTDFGEGVEFDYARTTRLVINAFGLEQLGRERAINVSASIDAAKLTKNLTHTSAGLKMSDVMGRDPLKNMKSFIVDEHSLIDLQSRNTIFLMKIVLTKETKNSFRLFDDIFQFFLLAGATNEERMNDPHNLEKYHWEQLADLKPLDVTTTTDMAADWKLVGAGGGVKKNETLLHFVSGTIRLCPRTE